MKQGAVAVRYAKALFSLAKEEQVLEQVYLDMRNIAEVVKEQTSFVKVLENPVIKKFSKIELFNVVFSQNLQAIVMSFLKLLIEKNRQDYLLAICNAFFKQYKAHKGYKEVHFTTSVAASPELEQLLNRKIAEILNVEVDLQTATDKSIIGGFILRIDDMLLDKSIATQLSEIKKELLSK